MQLHPLNLPTQYMSFMALAIFFFCDARACALDCARQSLQCKIGDPQRACEIKK